jgi:hypothetical protein
MRYLCRATRYAALFVLLAFTPPALAQGPPDPTAYLPTAAELPAGFVHRDDRELSIGGASGIVRSYTAPSGVLSVGVIVTPSAAAAETVLAQIPTSLQGDGFTFQANPGLLGDQTLTSTKAVGLGDQPTYSGAAVLFRVGALVGEAVLLEQPGPVSLDAVLAVARPVAQRAQASPAP